MLHLCSAVAFTSLLALSSSAMTIHTRIPAGYESSVIHAVSDSQQLLGPERARIIVHDEPELSPYDLELRVTLQDGRYVVTQLTMNANRLTDADDMVRLNRDGSEDDYYTPSVSGPVTAVGLGQVKLPPILRQSLRNHVTARRLMSNGEWSTGISEEDLVPTTYLLAQLVGDNPTVAVGLELGISRQIAAQRVSRARKAGLLPATTKGAR